MDFIVENERIYANNQEGKLIAEITFPIKDGVATIDHTFVDQSLRGQGIAGELVKLAADKILANGHRIAATCPYAVVWFQRHPHYTTVCDGTPPSCKITPRTGKHD